MLPLGTTLRFDLVGGTGDSRAWKAVHSSTRDNDSGRSDAMQRWAAACALEANRALVPLAHASCGLCSADKTRQIRMSYNPEAPRLIAAHVNTGAWSLAEARDICSGFVRFMERDMGMEGHEARASALDDANYAAEARWPGDVQDFKHSEAGQARTAHEFSRSGKGGSVVATIVNELQMHEVRDYIARAVERLLATDGGLPEQPAPPTVAGPPPQPGSGP